MLALDGANGGGGGGDVVGNMGGGADGFLDIRGEEEESSVVSRPYGCGDGKPSDLRRRRRIMASSSEFILQCKQ